MSNFYAKKILFLSFCNCFGKHFAGLLCWTFRHQHDSLLKFRLVTSPKPSMARRINWCSSRTWNKTNDRENAHGERPSATYYRMGEITGSASSIASRKVRWIKEHFVSVLNVANWFLFSSMDPWKHPSVGVNNIIWATFVPAVIDSTWNGNQRKSLRSVSSRWSLRRFTSDCFIFNYHQRTNGVGSVNFSIRWERYDEECVWWAR